MIATLWLYLVIPKGFLPQQDTGLIFAVMEGGDEVSFAEMQRLRDSVEAVIRKDPDVAGVVSVVGVTPINATPNASRFAITLRPRDTRRASIMTVIDRLQQEMLRIPGVILFFQPVQDIQIATRISRAQYQYTLTGTSAEDATCGRRGCRRLQLSPIMRDVASEAQEQGLRLMVNVDRELAGRLGVSLRRSAHTLNSAFGQRQISTIYAQSNQYRVILEAAATRAIPIRCRGFTSRAPAACRCRCPPSPASRTPAPLVIAHYEQFRR
jgi:multidrug efflux pump